MKKRTPDDDLDDVLRSGAGRRFLARFVAEGMVDSFLAATPEQTAFNLGVASVARNLDKRLRAINPDAWLLMHGEMLKAEDDEDKEADHDGP